MKIKRDGNKYIVTSENEAELSTISSFLGRLNIDHGSIEHVKQSGLYRIQFESELHDSIKAVLDSNDQKSSSPAPTNVEYDYLKSNYPLEVTKKYAPYIIPIVVGVIAFIIGGPVAAGIAFLASVVVVSIFKYFSSNKSSPKAAETVDGATKLADQKSSVASEQDHGLSKGAKNALPVEPKPSGVSTADDSKHSALAEEKNNPTLSDALPSAISSPAPLTSRQKMAEKIKAVNANQITQTAKLPLTLDIVKASFKEVIYSAPANQFILTKEKDGKIEIINKGNLDKLGEKYFSNYSHDTEQLEKILKLMNKLNLSPPIKEEKKSAANLYGAEKSDLLFPGLLFFSSEENNTGKSAAEGKNATEKTRIEKILEKRFEKIQYFPDSKLFLLSDRRRYGKVDNPKDEEPIFNSEFVLSSHTVGKLEQSKSKTYEKVEGMVRKENIAIANTDEGIYTLADECQLGRSEDNIRDLKAALIKISGYSNLQEEENTDPDPDASSSSSSSQGK